MSLRVVLKEQFTPGRGGSAALTVHKDRHGGLRRVCPTPKAGEAYAGTFILREGEGVTTWRIAAPAKMTGHLTRRTPRTSRH